MECKDISYYLCAYLDGELNLEESRPVEEHLKLCPNCRKELEFQQCVKALVKERLGRIVAPDYLIPKVKTELGWAGIWHSDSGSRSMGHAYSPAL